MHKIKSNTYGEQLLSSSLIGAVGFAFATSSLPSFSAREINEDSILDRAGNDYSFVQLSFSNINSFDIKRIIIYYEQTITGKQLPSHLTELQTMEVFTEINMLSSVSTLEARRPVKLFSADSTMYSFYAIYLNSSGKVVEFENKSVINYATNVLFSGLSSYSTILGAKDVRTANVNIIDDQDLNGSGFTRPFVVPDPEIDLICLDLKTLSDPQVFNQYENISYFYDTYGDAYELNYRDFTNVEYYVVYKFISSKGNPPQYKYPLHVNPASSLDTTISDVNGKWRLVGKYSTNRFTVPVEDCGRFGYWVGVKLGK